MEPADGRFINCSETRDDISLIRRIFVNTRNIKHSSYVWNIVSSAMFACQSAIMLIIISRACGLADAGVFSIAYSVASMMTYIGEYGVRKYQASDVNEECTFPDYMAHRIITCAMMVIASLLYGAYGILSIGYTWSKFNVLILICYIKLIETLHDLFYGRFQQLHRLDIAAKTTSFRTVFGMIVYAAALLVTHDLMISTLIWAIAITVGFLIPIIAVAPEYCDFTLKFRWDRIRKIFADCFPLFVGLFLLMYIGNASKYAIDATLDDETQAKFNFIFMPVFVIGLLANFIFNPILVEMADSWEERNYKAFKRIIKRQVIVITGLTLLAIAVALTIGCPVLGLMYHTDLSGEKTELVILMVGGGMLAMVNFITIVATIIRTQGHLTIGYILVSVMALLFAGRFVARFGLMGASSIYTILLTLLTVIFTIVIAVDIRRGMKAGSEAGKITDTDIQYFE